MECKSHLKVIKIMFPSWRRCVEWSLLYRLCHGSGPFIEPTPLCHPLSVFLETDITPERIGRWIVFIDWLGKSWPHSAPGFYQVIQECQPRAIPSLWSVLQFFLKRWFIDCVYTLE